MFSHAASRTSSGEVRRLRMTIAVAFFAAVAILVVSGCAPHVAAVAPASRPALFRSPACDSSRGAHFLQQVLTNPNRQAQSPRLDNQQICRPTGHIQDASCDYETVETINSQFFDRLDTLRKTPFFKFYKVNLFKECPFWNEHGFCMNRACSVETEHEHHVPQEFRVSRLASVIAAEPNDVVLTGSDASCSCSSTEFCHLDDESSEEAVYVDLLKNPERFTGYAGASANRVWKSIYEENCFNGVKFIEPARPTSSGGTGFVDKSLLHSSNPALGGLSNGFSRLVSSLQAPLDSGDSEQCLEKRVFYRIISGLHASISIHICHEFLDTNTGEWAPNLECFITRIAEHPERLQNVYFDYVLLLRALSRLGDSSQNFSLRDGDSIHDPSTVAQLDQLISDARACPTTFDEARMFNRHNRESLELKREFRQHFRNISAIMDCVGCDKCRLWGKLQVHGIGTALKLLFNRNDETQHMGEVKLQKAELVALVNAAHRIAESLRAVEQFRDMYQEHKLLPPASDAEPVQKPPSHHADQARRVHRNNHTRSKYQPHRNVRLGDSRLGSWLAWLEHTAEQSLAACKRSFVHCLHALGFVTGADTAEHSEL